MITKIKRTAPFFHISNLENLFLYMHESKTHFLLILHWYKCYIMSNQNSVISWALTLNRHAHTCKTSLLHNHNAMSSSEKNRFKAIQITVFLT